MSQKISSATSSLNFNINLPALEGGQVLELTTLAFHSKQDLSCSLSLVFSLTGTASKIMRKSLLNEHISVRSASEQHSSSAKLTYLVP